ncbi:Heparanase-like protein 3 [Platanthera zijinensis]|uniref:Heparanase-like protein 3 n=1 Tax=Platanthera zijinensis TaxID=2320716 RepID=A0AAP0B4P0_9ASPA
MGGGDGMGPVKKTAMALGESLYDGSQRKPIGQLIVICGRNQTLRSTLQLIQWKIPVKIWGFERHMEKWMGACDCIITKAGPGTIAEALIRGLPIILNDFIPGQDLSNPILVNALKAFSTIRLRLGGTKQDNVIYETGDHGLQPCIPFVANASNLFGFNEGCLPVSRWDQLNEFFQKTSAQVIFGLNALNGRVLMQDGSLGGPWNHENAKSLIRYTADKGYTIYGWELGNELSGKGIKARIGVAQYAADLISLKQVVDEIYQGNPVKPLVIAPGGNFEAGWYSEFIDMTKGSSSLDVITHHMYILGSGNGTSDGLVEKILNSSVLDKPALVFSCLRDIIRKSGTGATAWVGEAGGAHHGGHHLVTDSFVSSLWYLDQLGMSASYDTKSYCRQSLIGGNYGLLDTTTFRPNPDYYSALLWHQLMGPKVLSTSFIGTKNIRAYSHCARPSKGITLVLLNLDPNTTTHVTVKGSNFEQREEYHLTAGDGNLHSQTMLLNGEPLNVNSDGCIPALTPNKVDGSQPIKLAPLSIVFAHFRYFHAPACL